MKKYLLSFLVFGIAIIFIGCSLSNTPAQSSPQEFSFSNGIWKSIDGGKVWWEKIKVNQSPRAKKIDALAMAINPSDSRNILVGLKKGGIIKSDDGGESWDFTTFLPEKVYGVSIDPADGRTIYASGVWKDRGKIFKSSDAGVNWDEIYTTPASGPLVISMLLDKKNPKILYVTTSDNQILKTADGGATWKNIYTTDTPITKIAIDSVNSNLLFFITNSGKLLRSRNAGETIEDISGNISGVDFSGAATGMETDPTQSGWVYLAGNGIIRSKDAGNSWENVNVLHNPGEFPVRAVAINPRNSEELIYGTAQATYKSIDGGLRWATTQFRTGIPFSFIKYNPNDPTIVYTAFINK